MILYVTFVRVENKTVHVYTNDTETFIFCQQPIDYEIQISAW